MIARPQETQFEFYPLIPGHTAQVMSDVTTLLNALSDTKGANSEELLSVIYEELRKMAAGMIATLTSQQSHPIDSGV